MLSHFNQIQNVCEMWLHFRPKPTKTKNDFSTTKYRNVLYEIGFTLGNGCTKTTNFNLLKSRDIFHLDNPKNWLWTGCFFYWAIKLPQYNGNWVFTVEIGSKLFVKSNFKSTFSRYKLIWKLMIIDEFSRANMCSALYCI